MSTNPTEVIRSHPSACRGAAMTRKVEFKLTLTQADALVRLAECASNSFDDALGVLDDVPTVNAGYLALEIVNHAIHEATRAKS